MPRYPPRAQEFENLSELCEILEAYPEDLLPEEPTKDEEAEEDDRSFWEKIKDGREKTKDAGQEKIDKGKALWELIKPSDEQESNDGKT